MFLQEFPEHLSATLDNPAAGHIFKVQDDIKKQFLP